MSSFSELTDKLKKFNQYNKILAVLDSNDYSKVATTAYEALLSISKTLPRVRNPLPKNEKSSNVYRGMGNDEYKQDNLENALHYFNLAALHAPEGSKALALAYSNRSALFARIKKYSSALIDIDLCLNVGADKNLKDKLDKRREDCYNSLWLEAVEHNNALNEFNDSTTTAEEFFQVTGKRHPKFPFAKSCIDLVMKDGKERVVTRANLKVGEIVAVEPQFVSTSLFINKIIFCHYCSKYADNLIPCETCSVALFCNQACRARCLAEYHDIECQMIEIYQVLPIWYSNWFKFVIKSWRVVNEDMEKFAEISEKMDGYLNGTQEAMKLDMTNVVSYLLPVDFDHIKRFGKLYDTALFTALVKHGLNDIKKAVLKAFCKKTFIEHAVKQLMFHVMHSNEFSMSNCMLPLDSLDVEVSNVESIAVLPFTSRIRHDCDPTLHAVGLGDRMALIVLKPVLAGEELTIAYCGDYNFDSYEDRQFRTYTLFGFCCECRACAGRWPASGMKLDKNEQFEDLMEKIKWETSVKKKFEIVCDVLNGMEARHGDKRYTMCYRLFRSTLAELQHAVGRRRFHGDAEDLQVDDDVSNVIDYITRAGCMCKSD